MVPLLFCVTILVVAHFQWLVYLIVNCLTFNFNNPGLFCVSLHCLQCVALFPSQPCKDKSRTKQYPAPSTDFGASRVQWAASLHKSTAFKLLQQCEHFHKYFCMIITLYVTKHHRLYFYRLLFMLNCSHSLRHFLIRLWKLFSVNTKMFQHLFVASWLISAYEQ